MRFDPSFFFPSLAPTWQFSGGGGHEAEMQGQMRKYL
jgi:hypothetical protein